MVGLGGHAGAHSNKSQPVRGTCSAAPSAIRGSLIFVVGACADSRINHRAQHSSNHADVAYGTNSTCRTRQTVVVAVVVLESSNWTGYTRRVVRSVLDGEPDGARCLATCSTRWGHQIGATRGAGGSGGRSNHCTELTRGALHTRATLTVAASSADGSVTSHRAIRAGHARLRGGRRSRNAGTSWARSAADVRASSTDQASAAGQAFQQGLSPGKKVCSACKPNDWGRASLARVLSRRTKTEGDSEDGEREGQKDEDLQAHVSVPAGHATHTPASEAL